MPQRESRSATPEPVATNEEFLQLCDEVRVLREAMDDLREQLEHTLRNGPLNQDAWRATRPITSFPLDPAAPDWAARVNAVKPYSTPNAAEATPENEPYCCEQPRLVWLGDPDSPGIACENCGYLVAEAGQLCCWRDSADELPEQPPGSDERPSQRTLWSDDTDATLAG